MACSLSSPPCQILSLAGQQHGRTIPLAAPAVAQQVATGAHSGGARASSKPPVLSQLGSEACIAAVYSRREAPSIMPMTM